jgi:hypothetical protein
VVDIAQSAGTDEFDVYWMAPDEIRGLATEAGFEAVFWGGMAAEGSEGQPQGYLIARRS